jgi:outer membrane receptor protein involved in Fe transport
MKHIISIFTFLQFIFTINVQAQTNSLHGKILDSDQNALSGASLVIVGTRYGVSANEASEYLFDKLPSGKIKVQVSFVGFKTLTKEIDVQPGENYLDFTLESENIHLNSVTVTSQKRDQQILDVPITMSVIDAGFIKDNNINELDKLSEYVPGLQIRMQGTDRPSFVIRGLTSDEVSPAAQPRISVFYNNVPISRANGAAVEIFDMQQIDVLKGPQGTLFGRGAEIGAINYISNKPTDNLNGHVSAGIGNFNQRDLDGAINFPIIKDKLFVRVAGIYDYQDGYIKNTFGGRLNGKNMAAGRFSASYLATTKDKLDLVLNYQNDRNPGLGFLSMNYPNTEGSTNPFGYVASLEQGKNLANNRDIFDATLTMKHFFNENNFVTSISSYRKISTYTRWDGDGTAAPAIDFSENDGARQFYQEIRDNYSINNKLNGSVGASLWIEKASQNYWFSPNEQSMFHLIFNTGYLVTPDGQPVLVTNLPADPQLGPLAGLPLPTDHQEENNSNAVNKALDGFADANYQLTDKLSITSGIRVINEWISLTNKALMTGGSPSTLGLLTGNYPNLFFKPGDEKKINTSNIAFTWRGGLKYTFDENSNIFANYSRGRRPKVLQFTSAGEEQILAAEIVNSYDLGFKTLIRSRLWLDLGLFYYNYLNFQTSAWIADAKTGEFNYIIKDGGKASSHGLEANIKYAVLKGLQIFGNYAFINARFAANDVNGAKQEYANNTFRLTPEHSFAIGLNAKTDIAKDLYLFGIPSWSYKTKIFFEDANTKGIEQSGYGLANFTGGIGFKNIELAIFGTNLAGQKYIISAGNTGSLFGDPTRIPGPPRMFGAKINWKFWNDK